jgi:Phosphotransferase enzyme family
MVVESGTVSSYGGSVVFSVEEAAARFSLAIGMPVLVLGPLSGGETGATAIQLGNGIKRVLKWEVDRENQSARRDGAVLAERLRTQVFWPVPEQEVMEQDEVLFVSQEFMAGEVVDKMTHGLVEDILVLHERRLGLASATEAASWGRSQIEILTFGGRGYCLHKPLHDFDERTRRVVRRIEGIGRFLEPEQLAGNDIVHADLHPGNMLQSSGRLASIIDLDYARAGDAAFDLVFLAVSSLGLPAEPGVRRRLFETLAAKVEAPRRLAYSANLLLRMLDWPIRKARTQEIEFWLSHADRLLDSA